MLLQVEFNLWDLVSSLYGNVLSGLGIGNLKFVLNLFDEVSLLDHLRVFSSSKQVGI